MADYDEKYKKELENKIREIFADPPSEGSSTWSKMKSQFEKILGKGTKTEKKAKGGMVTKKKPKVSGRLAKRGYGKAMKGKK